MLGFACIDTSVLSLGRYGHDVDTRKDQTHNGILPSSTQQCQAPVPLTCVNNSR
jgi:hypothetical protein